MRFMLAYALGLDRIYFWASILFHALPVYLHFRLHTPSRAAAALPEVSKPRWEGVEDGHEAVLVADHVREVAIAYGSGRFFCRWLDRKARVSLVRLSKPDGNYLAFQADLCREVVMSSASQLGFYQFAMETLQDLIRAGHPVSFRSLADSPHPWTRENPHMPCKVCGKNYAHHPDDADEPWLTVLCGGARAFLEACPA